MILLAKPRPTRDGGMYHCATIQTEESIYSWSCVCKPRDQHDHEEVIKKIEERLIARDEVAKEYRKGFDKEVRRIGMYKYQLKSYGIRMDNVHKFTSFVRWYQWPLDEPDQVVKGLDFPSRDPKELPDSTDVLIRVNEEIVDDGNERAHYLHGLSHR